MKSRRFHLIPLVLAAALATPALAADSPAAVNARFVADDAPEAADIRAQGENAINRLAITLVREVTNAVAKDGAEAAVDVCHLKNLTTTKGVIDGLPRITAVKKTSLRLRSPANAPDAADQLALEQFKQQMDNGDAPSPILIQRVEPAGGAPEWRVYKPLGVAPKCMLCHGDSADQSPGLRAKLAKLYPTDLAAGYSTGEWRGVLRVTVAEAPAKKP